MSTRSPIPDPPSPPSGRYRKQTLFAGIGEEGQTRLAAGRVLLCGCGALGSVIAETLARAGVGFLRIVDRDFVELSNLQRQTLFDEHHVRERLPKAIAAQNVIGRINSEVMVEPIVTDIDHTNILDLVDGCDLILDGSDNFELRYLINDAALETNTPWIYAGCIGSHGQVMPIFPHETACLRCLMPEPPDTGATETCDTAGVLGPAINVIASLEATPALKLLSGRRADIKPELTAIDVWENTFRVMDVGSLRDQTDCPACKQGQRDWLSGGNTTRTAILCGRNAVQIAPAQRLKLDLERLAEKLRVSGDVTSNAYLLRLRLDDSDHELTIFPDGRTIVQGTEDIATARTLVAQHIGS